MMLQLCYCYWEFTVEVYSSVVTWLSLFFTAFFFDEQDSNSNDPLDWLNLHFHLSFVVFCTKDFPRAATQHSTILFVRVFRYFWYCTTMLYHCSIHKTFDFFVDPCKRCLLPHQVSTCTRSWRCQWTSRHCRQCNKFVHDSVHLYWTQTHTPTQKRGVQEAKPNPNNKIDEKMTFCVGSIFLKWQNWNRQTILSHKVCQSTIWCLVRTVPYGWKKYYR